MLPASLFSFPTRRNECSVGPGANPSICRFAALTAQTQAISIKSDFTSAQRVKMYSSAPGVARSFAVAES